MQGFTVNTQHTALGATETGTSDIAGEHCSLRASDTPICGGAGLKIESTPRDVIGCFGVFLGWFFLKRTRAIATACFPPCCAKSAVEIFAGAKSCKQWRQHAGGGGTGSVVSVCLFVWLGVVRLRRVTGDWA